MLWIQSMCLEGPSSINNCSNAGLFSDLMKFTAVNESLSYQPSNVLFQRKINWINTLSYHGSVMLVAHPLAAKWHTRYGLHIGWHLWGPWWGTPLLPCTGSPKLQPRFIDSPTADAGFHIPICMIQILPHTHACIYNFLCHCYIYVH